ncbi:hypothetical protein KOR34_28550 [Posidoniimonas corsicana]|uniref:DNA ligase D 3'-phosphoesterase domain-containing protein n=1 Tax=Posidoniimonas corsicana TaxID=1938618 RepID=A0A5C5VJ21_9BACT|nr:hypothetical protein [Posidoniimonas corsicana]TWT37889.1 hypothetical protein KOR34_28550 [Posidoniimonas corsicana]
MPRYVLLRHECPPDYRVGSHWDLMLEHESVLLTWSLSTLPAIWGGAEGVHEVAAEKLADHRLAYLDYEGPVSGNRGTVKRVVCGAFEWVSCDEECVEAELTSSKITLTNRGSTWLLSVVSK